MGKIALFNLVDAVYEPMSWFSLRWTEHFRKIPNF